MGRHRQILQQSSLFRYPVVLYLLPVVLLLLYIILLLSSNGNSFSDCLHHHVGWRQQKLRQDGTQDHQREKDDIQARRTRRLVYVVVNGRRRSTCRVHIKVIRKTNRPSHQRTALKDGPKYPQQSSTLLLLLWLLLQLLLFLASRSIFLFCCSYILVKLLLFICHSRILQHQLSLCRPQQSSSASQQHASQDHHRRSTQPLKVGQR